MTRCKQSDIFVTNVTNISLLEAAILKSLSYNKSKKYQIIFAIIFLFTFLIRFTLSQYLPLYLPYILMLASGALYVATALFCNYINIKNNTIDGDELSKSNEAKASKFTLKICAIIWIIISAVTIIIVWREMPTMITITIDPFWFPFILIAILVIKDGYYLFLERAGVKNAELDNED